MYIFIPQKEIKRKISVKTNKKENDKKISQGKQPETVQEDKKTSR